MLSISRSVAVFIAVAASSALAATAKDAQTKAAQPGSIDGDVIAGRKLALDACTGCHVVAADQPYNPIYKGAIRPPDFKDIVSKPNVNAASLRSFLASLPAIPKNSQMANVDLTEEELRDVTAFMMTLRDKSPPASSQSSSSR